MLISPERLQSLYCILACSPKSWSSSNWLKFGAGIHCYILTPNLMFVFSKNFNIFWANLVPKSDDVPIDWNLAFVYIHYRYYMLIIIKSCNISKFCVLQIGEIILYIYAKFQGIWRTAHFGMKLAPKIYERQILRKMTHQNGNQHTTMCPCIKFQSIWRTLDFRTKFAQNYMNDKILKK